MNPVYADLQEDHPDKIYVWFKYDQETVRRMSRVSGSKFVSREKGGPYWLCPLDFGIAQELRETFGEYLVVYEDLKEWGWAYLDRMRYLQKLASAKDAECPVLYEKLPDLHEWLRGYQRAGSAYIAEVDGSIVADQPGLGKTAQAIGGIYEAGADEGAHLVIAPVVSLETVWQRELEHWQPHPVWVPTGDYDARESAVEDFRNYVMSIGGPAWLVVNPQMVAFDRLAPEQCDHCGKWMPYRPKRRKEEYQCPKCELWTTGELIHMYEQFGEINWANLIIDECHKNAVRNPNTLTARAMFDLEVLIKKILMSGTPVANRPIDLWGMLHALDPKTYSSKWRWAGMWLEITDEGFGKRIGKVRKDRKKNFFKSLAPHVLRRTLGEVFSELPPAQHIDVWVDMGRKQRKQYVEFAEMAQIKIDTYELTATEKITEYLRLKQFAIATQDLIIEDDVVVPYPTFDSCKLDYVEELLDERGYFNAKGKFDTACEEKVVIFSQWERVVDMVMDWLTERKVPSAALVGRTRNKTRVQDKFQVDGGPQVIVMTTETGGVSITLDRANTCIFMDETWLATTMEQAVGRLRPQSPSRMTRPEDIVFAYYLRTRGTVDEYIKELVSEKGEEATDILDKRRLRLY